jgi:hypothetical protein
VLCLGYRIYNWAVLSVKTRVNNLFMKVRDINNNVYFDTLNVGLIFNESDTWLTVHRNSVWIRKTN